MPYRKRGALFKLCSAIFVGIVGFAIFTTNLNAGCAGDCMTCHPTLKGSIEHRSLESCIKCHNPAKDISIVPSNDNGCGDKCFDCHNEWPKDGHHADLDTCNNCHKK